MSTPLADSPAAIFRQMLVDLGVGSDPADPTTVPPTVAAAWPVYATGIPETPDDVIVVYDTDPVDDGRSMLDGERFLHVGLQVFVRAADSQVGWTKAESLAVTLDESVYQRTVTVNGNHYIVHCVNRIGGVLSLGKEVPISKRSLFSINLKSPVRSTS